MITRPTHPAEKYDDLLLLADLFDSSGQEMRARARLGADVLRDEAVAASSELSPTTFDVAADDIRAATTGTHGLLARSIELAADGLAVRATVLTYRWIDDLQELASRTLGSIAGRAIGYLAPDVELGGAILSAGVIETDALDRDGVADYLSDLAGANPDLMDHLASGGGGLVEALQLRSLLTSSMLAGDRGRMAAAGGLRAIGVEPFADLSTAAVRDVAGPVVAPELDARPSTTGPGSPPDSARAPRSLEDLMTMLSASEPVSVHRVGAARFIAYLPGPAGGDHGPRRLRLVNGDASSYAARAVAIIQAIVGDTEGATVMLVGASQGGVVAAEIAAASENAGFTVDQVVTAGAPGAQVPRLPDGTRMLSLEDRADPVALLGSLVSAGARDRLVVVFDAGRDAAGDEPAYVLGGRAADRADNADLRAEINRIHGLGYLAG
jgi:hypothetical protein